MTYVKLIRGKRDHIEAEINNLLETVKYVDIKQGADVEGTPFVIVVYEKSQLKGNKLMGDSGSTLF